MPAILRDRKGGVVHWRCLAWVVVRWCERLLKSEDGQFSKQLSCKTTQHRTLQLLFEKPVTQASVSHILQVLVEQCSCA